MGNLVFSETIQWKLPRPRLFFETKYFRDRYRDFFLRPNVFETDTETFFETKVFETDTETFFRDQIFLRPIPRLFFETKYFRDRYRDFFFETKYFETETDTFKKLRKVSIPRSLENIWSRK